MLRHNGPMAQRLKFDLTGRTFGSLRVVRRDSGKDRWECVCACGRTVWAESWNLRHYQRTCAACRPSPGLRTFKHGHNRRVQRTPEYRAWLHLRNRCLNPSDNAYAHYGAIGITVCQAWQASFDAFLADMGLRPSSAHSIDRINPWGHYEPGNCRWATPREQAENKRNTRWITFEGMTRTLRQWEEALRWPRHALNSRLGKGWSEARALTTPYTPRGGAASPGWTVSADPFQSPPPLLESRLLPLPAV